MTPFEYRIVPSPRRAKRAKGARTPQDRFARTLTEVINAEAAEGWEYLRADTLPVDEKKSMLSTATEVYQTVLVFRRVIAPVAQPAPADTPRPAREEPSMSREKVETSEPQVPPGAPPKPIRLGPAGND